MSEPDPLGPEARSLITDAEGADSATPRDKDRLRSRIALQIGVAAFGSAVSTAAQTAPAAAKGGISLFAKIIGAAVVGSVATLAVVHVSEAPPAAPTSATAPSVVVVTAPPPVTASTIGRSAPAPIETADEPSTAPSEGKPSKTPTSVALPRAPQAPSVVATTASAPAPTTTSTSPLPTPEPESVMVKRAETAISAGDGVTALEILDTHARIYPNGMLADLREVDRVLALCTIARAPAAREAAERYLAAHPRSAHADRIRRACGVP
ncbi:MAG: hypothetical protein QM702_21585 [Rubrivivax sp.]